MSVLRVGIGGKAVGFDEARIGGDFFQVMQHGIEPLDVADLENDCSFPRASRTNSAAWAALSVIGFSTSTCLPAARRRVGQFKMGGGGGDDAEGLGAGQGVVEGGENRDADIFRRFWRPAAGKHHARRQTRFVRRRPDPA